MEEVGIATREIAQQPFLQEAVLFWDSLPFFGKERNPCITENTHAERQSVNLQSQNLIAFGNTHDGINP